MDQAIEETANKDTRTPAGTTGFSLKHNAVSRYYITADYRRLCVRQLHEMVNMGYKSHGHPDLQHSHINRDERDIQQILDLFDSVWKNPFEDDNLSNIATGVNASPDVQVDILAAHDKGVISYNKYIEERLSASRSKSFMDTIPKLKLNTSTTMNKKVVSYGGKDIELKVDRNLFAKMSIIAQNRKLDMKEVMKYELGPFPWSFATCDGMLLKTNKATLSKDIEKMGSYVENILPRCACIIDAMSFVQKTIGNHKLFLTMINEGKGCSRIDIIFDVYKSLSIKNAE